MLPKRPSLKRVVERSEPTNGVRLRKPHEKESSVVEEGLSSCSSSLGQGAFRLAQPQCIVQRFQPHVNALLINQRGKFDIEAEGPAFTVAPCGGGHQNDISTLFYWSHSRHRSP